MESRQPGVQDSAFNSPTFGEDGSFDLDKPVGSMSISPCGRDVVLASYVIVLLHSGISMLIYKDDKVYILSILTHHGLFHGIFLITHRGKWQMFNGPPLHFEITGS